MRGASAGSAPRTPGGPASLGLANTCYLQASVTPESTPAWEGVWEQRRLPPCKMQGPPRPVFTRTLMSKLLFTQLLCVLFLEAYA